MKLLRYLSSILVGFGLGFAINGLIRWLFHDLAPLSKPEFEDKNRAAALAVSARQAAENEGGDFVISAESTPVSAQFLFHPLPNESSCLTSDENYL
jgi:hypothetical protein